MDVAAMWDQMFGASAYRCGAQPNPFLAEQAPKRLAPGAKVLVVGDGEGRNGIWLAQQAFSVTR